MCFGASKWFVIIMAYPKNNHININFFLRIEHLQKIWLLVSHYWSITYIISKNHDIPMNNKLATHVWTLDCILFFFIENLKPVDIEGLVHIVYPK